jgi:ribose-phosphate pyrophosphokinase
MEQSRGALRIFANRSGEVFAKDMIKNLNQYMSSPAKPVNIELGEINSTDFADGEYKPEIEDTVRGCDCYLVQNCFDPMTNRSVQDNFFEALSTIYALKGAGAKKATLIMPYHPFSRQDKTKTRAPITMRLVADMVSTAGADNVLTTDLHADQETGFYDPVKGAKIDNLRFSNILIPELKKIFPRKARENLVVMGPDAGGTDRAQYYAKMLGTEMAHSYKKRSYTKANTLEELKVLGDFKGKDIFVIDDMIDTGGSICNLVGKLREEGAKNIMVGATHLLLNKDAVKKLSDLEIQILGSDSVPRKSDFFDTNPNFRRIPHNYLYAMAIYNLNHHNSLEPVYEG